MIVGSDSHLTKVWRALDHTYVFCCVEAFFCSLCWSLYMMELTRCCQMGIYLLAMGIWLRVKDGLGATTGTSAVVMAVKSKLTSSASIFLFDKSSGSL